MRSLRILLVCAVLAMVSGAAALLALETQLSSPLLPQGPAIRVTLLPGNGIQSVARQLHDLKLVDSPRLFAAAARWQERTGPLKAGSYELRPGMTGRDLLAAMARGDAILERIRFIEGWTFRQMRQVVDEHPALRHDSSTLKDAEILQRLEAPAVSAEGLFFPDSYQFAAGASDLTVWRQALQRMRAVLDDAWARRDPSSPLGSPYQALVLASIVEKETGREEDRPLVAAVFVNRLRLGMPLQSDPTVIYGMGDAFDGNLRRVDLRRDTPYNTYTRPGLPPTPIAAPGAASLRGVTRPLASAALYFVARGDGSSEFSSSLAAHNRAVDRYQRR